MPMMIIAMVPMNQGFVKIPMIFPPFLFGFWVKIERDDVLTLHILIYILICFIMDF